jgi:hypothetical protein
MDFGTYYWTGLGTTRFAVVITNFGADVAPSGTPAEFDGSTTQSFQSFSLPTLFKIGFAMDPILTDEHRLTASIQLNHPNDNVEHGRFGVEYAWRNTFFLRGGIKRTIGQQLLGADETSEESFALGTGVRVVTGLTTVGADYAFVSYSRLGSVHRITVNMTY